MKVEIYSDVVCPWCYVGERRFERALAAFQGADEVEVVFRPYQLDPGAPAEALPLTQYLASRYGPHVEAMQRHAGAAAESVGIRVDWGRALAANTRTAHRLLGLALREHGPAIQRALAERLFGLHFERGGDVSDHRQLSDEAAAVGMDRERVRAYLESAEGVEETEAELSAARELGIRAVPTFVFDGARAIEGAQSPATFLAMLEETARTAAGPSPDASCEDGAYTV